MNAPFFRILLIIVLILFSALTAWGVHTAGGIIAMVRQHLNGPVAWQIFADLVITLCLLLVFIKRDSVATGRTFWPWAVFSLAAGSFGPLLYLITRKKSE